MAGLPVGGPYDIEMMCGVESVVVKDVWILAGQSNMEGCGHFPRKPLGKDTMVRACYMDDHWDVAVTVDRNGMLLLRIVSPAANATSGRSPDGAAALCL